MRYLFQGHELDILVGRCLVRVSVLKSYSIFYAELITDEKQLSLVLKYNIAVVYRGLHFYSFSKIDSELVNISNIYRDLLCNVAYLLCLPNN